MVIATWFQGWAARQIDLGFFCASILVSTPAQQDEKGRRRENNWK